MTLLVQVASYGRVKPRTHSSYKAILCTDGNQRVQYIAVIDMSAFGSAANRRRRAETTCFAYVCGSMEGLDDATGCDYEAQS